ncbi:hypothetical protein RFI_07333 [Reticulomyxa filosa]|uniref:Uncharacterized protein n=1 Tax=Reticulomyxa filosa TaxID=46433 RepID=X6NU12_RETFI|nr:hypothetical protein RFI_07333 [Reticulomyxa filosa]|eukprot:ETO29785.1 hypothetical protein RFI_07333 [Reticulomyxa filosa]
MMKDPLIHFKSIRSMHRINHSFSPFVYQCDQFFLEKYIHELLLGGRAMSNRYIHSVDICIIKSVRKILKTVEFFVNSMGVPSKFHNSCENTLLGDVLHEQVIPSHMKNYSFFSNKNSNHEQVMQYMCNCLFGDWFYIPYQVPNEACEYLTQNKNSKKKGRK